jgi:hypothetical protein
MPLLSGIFDNNQDLIFIKCGKIYKRTRLQQVTYNRSTLININSAEPIIISLETSYNDITITQESQVTVTPVPDTTNDTLVQVNLLGILPVTNPVLIYTYIQNFTRYTVNHILIWSDITAASTVSLETTLSMPTMAAGIIEQDGRGVVTRISPNAIAVNNDNYTWLTYTDSGMYTGQVRVASNGKYILTAKFNTAPASNARLAYKLNSFNLPMTSSGFDATGTATITDVELDAGDNIRLWFYTPIGFPSLSQVKYIPTQYPITITIVRDS